MTTQHADTSAIIVGAVVLLVIAVVGMPLAVIWSLNTLIGLSIPVTLTSWFAAFILIGAFGGGKSGGSSK